MCDYGGMFPESDSALRNQEVIYAKIVQNIFIRIMHLCNNCINLRKAFIRKAFFAT